MSKPNYRKQDKWPENAQSGKGLKTQPGKL